MSTYSLTNCLINYSVQKPSLSCMNICVLFTKRVVNMAGYWQSFMDREEEKSPLNICHLREKTESYLIQILVLFGAK